MGDMAHETMDSAVRRAQEDLSGDTQPGDVGHGTPVPGTESAQPETAAPQPAGAENADSQQGTTDTVPYSRFKEVNDQYRELRTEFGDIAEAGYDGDSVRRLVGFEQAYAEDPVGTISSVVDNMDLPDAQKAAVKAALGQPAQVVEPAEGDEPEDPPAWAKPLIEDHEARSEAEEHAFYDGLLQQSINEWQRLDKEEGLTTPDRTILRHIRGAIDEGGFQDVKGLAKVARDGAMEFREHTLGSAVRTRGTGPLSVPGSGVGQGAEPVKFDNIKQASRAAAEAWERGELPPITPER